MDAKINKIAALANAAFYTDEATRRYVVGAPHIKYASLRSLYAGLILDVYEHAVKYGPAPKVLDLGAGEGAVTLPLLDLGARVTAVDISESQLKALEEKCRAYGSSLEIRCADIFEVLESDEESYDVVVANSFLHHIPDYLGLIKKAVKLLSPHGQFFAFQEPMRYDTAGKFTMTFTHASYVSWRLFRGDLIAGAMRRVRRMRGIYTEESDNEYHVLRNGVDEEAVCDLLASEGFDCQVVKYFSTQNPMLQPVGAALKIKNTFAVTARRP